MGTIYFAIAVFLNTASLAWSQQNLTYIHDIHRPDIGSGRFARFGARQQIDDDKLLVSATHDFLAGDDAGAAYLFDLDGSQLATFANPLPDNGDFFGDGLAVSNDLNRVALGGFFDDIDGNNSGVAHLFDFDGNLIAEIRNPGVEPDDDGFGGKFAFVGNHLLISAASDDTLRPHSGVVHIYDENGNYQKSIFPPEESLGTAFGIKLVALSDDRFLVGMSTDLIDGLYSGAAYIMDLEGRVLHQFVNPEPTDFDHFGGLGMNSFLGEYFLFGIVNDQDRDSFEEEGYVFNLAGDLLLTIPDPNPAFRNWFARSMETINNELIVVSAIFDDAQGEDKGAVYLFNFQGELVESLYSPDLENSKFFGSSLAVSGDRLYIGDDGTTIDGVPAVGVVRVYELVYRPGDANWDGEVDLDDFALLKDNFGTGTRFREGNFDRTGTVDLNDFNILKQHFGTNAANVPEPSTWLLAVLGSAGLSFSRRRRASRGRRQTGDRILPKPVRNCLICVII